MAAAPRRRSAEGDESVWRFDHGLGATGNLETDMGGRDAFGELALGTVRAKSSHAAWCSNRGCDGYDAHSEECLQRLPGSQPRPALRNVRKAAFAAPGARLA